jgi:hypothetical protein
LSDILVQIIFGWPAILVSFALCVAGLLLKKVYLVVIGAVLFVPVSLFLRGYPSLRWLAPFLPIFLSGSTFALYKKKMLFAWLLVLQVIIFNAWLAIIVLAQ